MEKGFERTAFDLESVDPKGQVNSENRRIPLNYHGLARGYYLDKKSASKPRKGIRLIFLNHMLDILTVT